MGVVICRRTNLIRSKYSFTFTVFFYNIKVSVWYYIKKYIRNLGFLKKSFLLVFFWGGGAETKKQNLDLYYLEDEINSKLNLRKLLKMFQMI